MCQTDRDENLQWLSTIGRKNTDEIEYVSISTDLKKSNELNCKPIQIEIDLLDEGLRIGETLGNHKKIVLVMQA